MPFLAGQRVNFLNNFLRLHRQREDMLDTCLHFFAGIRHSAASRLNSHHSACRGYRPSRARPAEKDRHRRKVIVALRLA